MRVLALSLLVAAAAWAAPSLEYKFVCERSSCFVQEQVTVDANNHFIILGQTVGGQYRHEGELSESEVELFLTRVRTSLGRRPSQEIEAGGWRQSIRTRDLSWQGPWSGEDDAWYGGSWMEREKARARPPLIHLEAPSDEDSSTQ